MTTCKKTPPVLRKVVFVVDNMFLTIDKPLLLMMTINKINIRSMTFSDIDTFFKKKIIKRKKKEKKKRRNLKKSCLFKLNNKHFV